MGENFGKRKGNIHENVDESDLAPIQPGSTAIINNGDQDIRMTLIQGEGSYPTSEWTMYFPRTNVKGKVFNAYYKRIELGSPNIKHITQKCIKCKGKGNYQSYGNKEC